MGNPYLSSDESLILSTHQIRINGVSLDLMLTSRRLILIDNSVTPFQLRTIPLETIITVFAGTDVKGDPIFTLSHMDPSGTGAPHPMDIIFTRQKGEQRTKECNEWASTLGNHAAKARNEALSAGTLPYDPVKVIQPRMSATYRIETCSPRKPVREAYPADTEPVRSPELPKHSMGEEIPAGTGETVLPETGEMFPIFDSSVVTENEPEQPALPDAEISNAGTVPSLPVVPEEWVESPVPAAPKDEFFLPIPSETENASYVPAGQIVCETPVEELPEPVATVSLQTGDASWRGGNPAFEDIAQKWADAVRTVTAPVPPVFPEPAPKEVPAGGIQDDKPPAATDRISTMPEEPAAVSNNEIPAVTAGIPGCPAADEPAVPLEPEECPVPAVISLPAPKTRMGSYQTLVIAAIVVIILAVLGAGIVGQFSVQNPGNALPPAVVPVVTAAPTATPLPSPVPVDGVWVRIEYPGTFIGEVGNAQLMHPVSGSGVRFYKILWSDRIVEASARKQENSGETLLIEVYNNGTLIKRSATRVPMGVVTILIDPVTSLPPGIEQGDIP